MRFSKLVLASGYPFIKLFNGLYWNKKVNDSGRLRILVYHNILPEEYKLFLNQIRWLLRKWKFISPEKFQAIIDGKEKIQSDSLLLTFDDGFYSNRLVTEKILNEMNIKALFFIITNFIEIEQSKLKNFLNFNLRITDDKIKSYDDWSSMKKTDIKYLIDSGHTIGAHTLNHARLSSSDKNSFLNKEIVNGGNILEDLFNVKIKHFAFTFGDYNSISKKSLAIAKSRYSYIYTSLRGNVLFPRKNNIIPRDTLSPEESNYLIGSYLLGGVDFMYKRKIKMLDKMNWEDKDG
jgi:peptidoglycan/xylan/chitin deacetylase (PgdA/CDA1 family)